MDAFNGQSEHQIQLNAKKCATDAKCDIPAFTEGFRSAESKFNTATVKNHKLDDEASRVIGNRLGAAVESHM